MAYLLVIFEERLHLRKSKPVVFFGCFMWILVALYEAINGEGHAEEKVTELVGEVGELFFFLLVAMTFINALQERMVFASLRAWLIRRKMTYRQLFLVTGAMTFVLSPIADNLTSALVMATVVNAVAGENRKFMVPAFVNIVVAANAGGAWSPFGDVTTLMVWTSGKVQTHQFLPIILPSLVNWLVPAALMYLFVPKETATGSSDPISMKPGAKHIILLGFMTIAMTVSVHQFLHLPPFIGMMTGLGILMFFGHQLKIQDRRKQKTSDAQFDIFRKVRNVEFDTLLFFFGILLAVGALQYIGYLATVSDYFYGVNNTSANVIMGVFSAIVDNIPVTYAVLQMDPAMNLKQWLLLTLAVGTGGSMLSIGSAAGVAVMGVRRDVYTFLSHLKWTWAVALGYGLSVIAWWFTT